MPYALAGGGPERNERVREQIVTDTVRSVEIERRGPGGNEYQATLFVQAHAGPVVRRATGLPRILWPGVIAELAGMRDGMKAPANLAASHIKGTDVARRRGQVLRHQPTDDEQVLRDN